MGRADAGVETRLRKRLRSGRSPQAADDGVLADVDPRLMTERQQLAFLLRATAADASSASSADESPSGESDTDTGGSSDEEEFHGVFERRAAESPRPRGLRRLRRAADQPVAKTKRAATRRTAVDASAAADRKAESAELCALCCGRPSEDPTAALFLCAACDRKYPTQQALGRACAA